MKRSEAVDIIDEVLYQYEVPLLQGIAKHILRDLLIAGFLPAHKLNSSTGDFTQLDYDDISGLESTTDYKFRFEPES